MTTSGLDSWIPTIGEIIDDALEYAGVDPASANARHLKSAMRSINQVYLCLENRNEALFRDDIETVSIRAGQPFFYAPDGTLSVKKGTIRSVGQPTSSENNIEVYPKAVWFDMPAKGQVGRPSIMALIACCQPSARNGASIGSASSAENMLFSAPSMPTRPSVRSRCRR